MNRVVQAKTPSALSTLLLLGLLFLATWLPRATQLNAFVTPDERRWLQRSANFLVALNQEDFSSTYQAGHPGVTVMWAGTAGLLSTFPSYPDQVSGPMNEDQFDAWIRANSSISLLQLLVAGRRWIVLAISLGVALTFLPLRALLGSLTAFLATLLVAWEPFHIGLSRELHPDGLLATLTLLALASFAAWLYDRRRLRYLILTAIMTALAILTKSPALVAPFVIFLLLCGAWLRARALPERRAFLWRSALQMLAIGAVTFVALWPATWTLWQDAFMRVFNLALEYSQQGHELPLYFWGQTLDNPGPLFYPVTYLMRSTPATLIGLLLALVGWWRGWLPFNTPKVKQMVIAFLLFTLVYVIAVTVAQKKMDRYLLPALPTLTVIATVGWVSAATAIGNFLRRSTTLAAQVPFYAVLGVALIPLHAFFSALNYPYYLTYYNPIFGGSRSAPAVMMVGWGEGLEKAAAWLNQQPVPVRRVVAWYGEGPLSYFLNPNIEILPFYADGTTTDEYWFDADYAVLYVNQWQRENPSREIIDYFMARSPAYRVFFAGLDLVHVYSLRDLPPPEITDLHRIDDAIWDNKINLVGYYLKDTTIFPGEKIPVALYWRGLAPIAQDYTLEVTLRDAAGRTLWDSQRSPAGIETSDWPVDKLWRDAYTLEVPGEIAPGSYELVTHFRAPNGDLLPVSSSGQGEDNASAEGGIVVTTLNVQQPEVVAIDNAVWDGAQITTVAAYTDSVTSGSALLVDVTATVTKPTPRKLSLRLLDAAGATIAQNDQLFEPAMRFRLLVPAEASTGSYSLVAVLYDPTSLAAIPDQHDAQSVELSRIEIE